MEIERLGDRHLGRLGHREVAGARRILQQLSHPLGLSGDRTDTRDRAEGPRRVEHSQRMTGGRRVQHDQVIAGGAPAPALALRELPDLDHAHELLGAGSGGGEVLEGAAGGEQPA